MTVDARQLAQRYWDLLQDYLAEGGEGSMARGYEFARQAMADGCGVLEMAAVHHQALVRLSGDQVVKAGEFFAECLSPFEMSHRGAQDGARALRHLNELLEAELKKVAHAVHDEAGQLLASVHIALADVADELPPSLYGRFDNIKNLLRQIETELRNLSHELRPTVLDNLGLFAALEFLGERVSRRTGLRISVNGEAEPRLPAAVETALYRIVQEALNNIVKHAQAQSVQVQLRRTPGKATCSIVDDGCGFDIRTAPAGHGMGLLGIRERLNAVGGSLHIVSAPTQGTTLFADIPLGG
jgi:signal transduction histidine kinase